VTYELNPDLCYGANFHINLLSFFLSFFLRVFGITYFRFKHSYQKDERAKPGNLLNK
jgi:hypothetical protein